MLPAKRILILISHSYGELDVIFPILAGLAEKHRLEVEILFAVESLYQKYQKDSFAQFCTHRLGCRATFLRLPNKFDPYFQGRLGRVRQWYWSIALWPALWSILKACDIWMHELTDPEITTGPFHWANHWLRKPRFVYHHAHAVRINMRIDRQVLRGHTATFLAFDDHAIAHFTKVGYPNHHHLGYPRYFPEWRKLVDHYLTEQHSTLDGHVVIFTRTIRPWLDQTLYTHLIKTAYQSIRQKLGNVPIVIKPHPREKLDILHGILKEMQAEGVEVSMENGGILCARARLVIAFRTSAVLDALAVGIPAIEYCVETKEYLAQEPGGSPYRALGIDFANTPQELDAFLDRMLHNQYQAPTFVGELRRHRDVTFLEPISQEKVGVL